MNGRVWVGCIALLVVLFATTAAARADTGWQGTVVVQATGANGSFANAVYYFDGSFSGDFGTPPPDPESRVWYQDIKWRARYHEYTVGGQPGCQEWSSYDVHGRGDGEGDIAFADQGGPTVPPDIVYGIAARTPSLQGQDLSGNCMGSGVPQQDDRQPCRGDIGAAGSPPAIPEDGMDTVALSGTFTQSNGGAGGCGERFVNYTATVTWLLTRDSVPPECNDGIDNDGDGQIDFSGGIDEYRDPSCDGVGDLTETDRQPAEAFDAVDDTVSLRLTPAEPVVTVNITGNDTFPVGTSLVSVGQPAVGAATVVAGNTVSYIGRLAGADHFSYTLQDPLGRTDTATVRVDVEACFDVSAGARSRLGAEGLLTTEVTVPVCADGSSARATGAPDWADHASFRASAVGRRLAPGIRWRPRGTPQRSGQVFSHAAEVCLGPGRLDLSLPAGRPPAWMSDAVGLVGPAIWDNLTWTSGVCRIGFDPTITMEWRANGTYDVSVAASRTFRVVGAGYTDAVETRATPDDWRQTPGRPAVVRYACQPFAGCARVTAQGSSLAPRPSDAEAIPLPDGSAQVNFSAPGAGTLVATMGDTEVRRSAARSGLLTVRIAADEAARKRLDRGLRVRAVARLDFRPRRGARVRGSERVNLRDVCTRGTSAVRASCRRWLR